MSTENAVSSDGAPLRLATGQRHTLVLASPVGYDHPPMCITLRYARLWDKNVPWRDDLTPAEIERGLQRGADGNPSTAGSRYMSRNSRNHNGIDIHAPVGTPVYAVFAGTVVRCVSRENYDGNSAGYRVYIERRPGGDQAWYFHLSSVASGIRVGARVTAGQELGRTGVTGNAHPSDDPRSRGTGDGSGREPHLHFELHPGGKGAADPSVGLQMGKWEWER